MKERRRPIYKVRSGETWDLIRTEYLRGVTARQLAARFDVTEDNIRKRATRDGWTKRDYAEAAEGPRHVSPSAGRPLQAPPPLEPVDVFAAARAAFMHGARAAAAGRAVEAQALIRAAEAMCRLAKTHPDLVAPSATGFAAPEDGPASDADMVRMWDMVGKAARDVARVRAAEAGGGRKATKTRADAPWRE